MPQKRPKQINTPDNSALNENPQLDTAVRLQPKASSKSRKRKYFPEDSTRIVLRLKKLIPNLHQLSSNTSVEMDDFIKDYMENFEFTLRNLTRYKKPKTLSVREMECATRLVLPPELAQRAVVAAERAVLEAKSRSGEFRLPSDDSMETLATPSTAAKPPGTHHRSGEFRQPSDVSVETLETPSTVAKPPGTHHRSGEFRRPSDVSVETSATQSTAAKPPGTHHRSGEFGRPSDVSVETLKTPSTAAKPPETHHRSGIFRKQSDVYVETPTTPSTATKAPGIRKKKSGSGLTINFGIYILRLKKLRQPDLQLSKESLGIVNSILDDVITEFQLCVRSLLRRCKTLSVHDLESATKLCLPPVLGQCAKEYGIKAVKLAQRP